MEQPIPVVLSRLRITGPIDEHTPLIVLLDIADAHGIRLEKGRESERDYIVNLIHTTPIKTVFFPFSEQDAIQVAMWINRNSDWPYNSLLDAFAFLMSFIDNPSTIIEEVTTDFIFGSQTPAITRSLNPCVLYKICRDRNYVLPYTISLDQLATVVYLLAGDLDKTRCLFYQQTSTASKEAIISMFLAGCHAPPVNDDRYIYEEHCALDGDNLSMTNTPISYETINASSEAFKNSGYLLSRVVPTNSAEAIVLAALSYKIDISSAYSPIEEYLKMKEDASKYVPLDETLKAAVQANPYYLDLSTFFNPSLPLNLYVESDLVKIAETEGFTTAQLQNESPYSLLQSVSMSNTFHHGKLPTIHNLKFCISGEDVASENNENIVCYGVKSVSVFAYTYEELAQLFEHYKNFTNPMAKNEVFSKISINKLTRLCSIKRAGEVGTSFEARNKLSKNISIIKALHLDASSKLSLLRDIYTEATPALKSSIIDILTKILHASMYMRGWKGEGPYPVESADVPREQELNVEKNVVESIYLLETSIASLNAETLAIVEGGIGKLILDLPLYKFKGEFIVSTTASEGLTLGERIVIVKNGISHVDHASCIRFSSNWICSSVYQYMLVLGLPLPFVVEKLRDIR